MSGLINLISEFNIVTVIIRILLALFIGGLIGNERGRHGRAAGLRTHILVCVGSAMASLTSLYLSEELGYTSDVSRISAQVISGIGFLGAGTIMVRNSSVITGLTTAAGMWVTATIGLATGFGFYIGAIVTTVVCIFSVTVFNRFERSTKNSVNIYIEISDLLLTNRVVEIMNSNHAVKTSYDIIPAKSGNPNNVGIICSVANEDSYKIIKNNLEKIEEVVIMISDINT